LLLKAKTKKNEKEKNENLQLFLEVLHSKLQQIASFFFWGGGGELIAPTESPKNCNTGFEWAHLTPQIT